jgi:hypothetical protein
MIYPIVNFSFKFEYDQELADMLRGYSYTITNENYYPDLEGKRKKASLPQLKNVK